MGKPTGFMETPRQPAGLRPKTQRLKDSREIGKILSQPHAAGQAARCMDCGVPFCHAACPLANRIPEWNDAVYRQGDRAPHRDDHDDPLRQALQSLEATNNFPEFTGRLCPAPCEPACVLGITDAPVTIKNIELNIIERGFEAGWVHMPPPNRNTGKAVAIVGSGPTGLAAAAQLRSVGHHVEVFERDDAVGGLLRYGIPDFKMEKRILDRRLRMLEAMGVVFHVGVEVGRNHGALALRQKFDALLLACGATQPRALEVPYAHLPGVVYAMPYLTHQNRLVGRALAAEDPALWARDRDVVILGGGDTGADCLGSALRQKARSVAQIEINDRPPAQRTSANPWPTWPHIFRESPAHLEGGRREFALSTLRFVADDAGALCGLMAARVQPGRAPHDPALNTLGKPLSIPCDMAIVAIGFSGPEAHTVISELDVSLTPRCTVACDARYMTNVDGVFAAGDAKRGQSLIVWALAEGRSAAHHIDAHLMGQSQLPRPL